MQLLLLRHADASTVAKTDDARPLSEKGRLQAKHMGKFCRAQHICPEIILTSPLRRAEETAGIVAEELECPTVVEAFLASGMTPAVAWAGLREYQRFERILIVGHEPDFSSLVASFIGLESSEGLQFRKAMLVGLEVGALRERSARLEWMIPAKFV